MSYCVNCGVELNSNEKRCPLCSTPVINPNIDSRTSEIPPYPSRSELVIERKIKHTTAILITIILVVPLIICPLCDYLISHGFTWSLTAVISIVVGWILTVPPMLMRNEIVLKSAWLYFFSIIIYLRLINQMETPQSNWFGDLAFPIVCFLMLAFMIIFMAVRFTKLKSVTVTAIVMILVGIFSVVVDVLTNMFVGNGMSVFWSLPVIIASLALALGILVVSRLTRLKAAIKKRIHI